jgi:2-dehydro-3-deoxygluconokinase
MPRVVTFGELMLRLSPPGFERLPAVVRCWSPPSAAAKRNVAVSLALFGIESVLRHGAAEEPDRRRGRPRAARRRASAPTRSSGAATGSASTTPRRRSQRGSAVTYDRANSSIAEMKPDAVDWPATMTGADWLHVTGITPALGANGAEGTRRACAAARAAGAKVSVDLNFRKKLWTETQAQAGDGPADARRRHRHRQRRGPAVGARRPRARHRRHQRSARLAATARPPSR